MMYSYEWFGYGMEITNEETGRSCFLQGEEASELYDQLESARTDRAVQRILSEYSVLMEED